MHQHMQGWLRRPATEIAARSLLIAPFWISGLMKLFHFNQAVMEMARAGLEPAPAFALATIVTQLAGSALVVTGRGTWLGAGALGVFTSLTILLVHRFWAIAEEPFRTVAFHTAVEHVGMIGGLLAIAVLAACREAA